jgi:hypothetical protein
MPKLLTAALAANDPNLLAPAARVCHDHQHQLMSRHALQAALAGSGQELASTFQQSVPSSCQDAVWLDDAVGQARGPVPIGITLAPAGCE